MRKRLIRLGAIIVVPFSILLLWANWSAPSWTTQLPKHDFRIYRFSAKEIQEPQLQNEGISATSWSEGDKVLSVIFDPAKISVQEIEKKIRIDIGDFTIVESEEVESACPVPHDATWVSDLKSALCFRSPQKNIH